MNKIKIYFCKVFINDHKEYFYYLYLNSKIEKANKNLYIALKWIIKKK